MLASFPSTFARVSVAVAALLLTVLQDATAQTSTLQAQKLCADRREAVVREHIDPYRDRPGFAAVTELFYGRKVDRCFAIVFDSTGTTGVGRYRVIDAMTLRPVSAVTFRQHEKATYECADSSAETVTVVGNVLPCTHASFEAGVRDLKR